jgi:manganese/zinc/iron transport system substrate-binding protein
MRGFLLVLVAVVGCNQANDQPQPVRTDREPQTRAMRVVATTGMIADAAKIIGGEHIKLKTLMGPGVDPHQYKPTPSDIRDLQTAQLVLYNGLHLEGKMTDVLHKPGSKMSVAVTRDLDQKADLRPAPPGFEGVHDPHVWFDVALWSKCVGTMGAAMAEVDPEHAADYTKRAQQYQAELATLHQEVKDMLKAVPEERRVLITAHDAFYYFGRAYDFEVRGLQGVSTASEPSTRDVQELAKLIGTRKVSAIFGETSVPDRNLQAVVDAADKDYKVKVKFIAGKLFSDAMGAPDTPEGKYVGMIRHNVNTIVGALKE